MVIAGLVGAEFPRQLPAVGRSWQRPGRELLQGGTSRCTQRQERGSLSTYRPGHSGTRNLNPVPSMPASPLLHHPLPISSPLLADQHINR